MNKITTTLLISGALVFSGCKKWLEVKPEGQSTKDELFQSQKGFRDALTGAYLDMKSSDAYGGALTWTTVEYMARNWDVINTANTGLMNLTAGNYTDAGTRTLLDNMYIKEYKIIADVNSILERIDERKDIFLENNYALTKGEALAIRAFAHFDVLRMYGPMPDKPTAAPILPYVQAVSKDIVTLSTYDDFAKQILADLDQAEVLLKDIDPVTQYSMAELNPSTKAINVPPVLSDDYLMYRQIRMNYNAVLALKARVYNWLVPRGEANRANAVKYAQMIIDAKDRNGKAIYRLGDATDVGLGDFTFPSEHIAAVNNYNLKIVADNNFGEPGQLARTDFNIQDGFYYLNNLFPVSERATDCRWLGMWSYKTTAQQTGYVKYKKYVQRETGDPTLQIPLLRLSEMYLILTECALSKTEAENYYRVYCSTKGIPFANGFNAADWVTDRKNKMIREYVREFYAEGQSFFTFKRYNVATLPASWTAVYYNVTSTRYLVPKPDREINYHNN